MSSCCLCKLLQCRCCQDKSVRPDSPELVLDHSQSVISSNSPRQSPTAELQTRQELQLPISESKEPDPSPSLRIEGQEEVEKRPSISVPRNDFTFNSKPGGDNGIIKRTGTDSSTAFNLASMDPTPGNAAKFDSLSSIKFSISNMTRQSTKGVRNSAISARKSQIPELSMIQQGLSTEPSNIVPDESMSAHTEGEFVKDFDFGLYLEYWKRNPRNYVEPKYKNLRQELTKNRCASITEQEYFKLERSCLNLERKYRNKFKAKNIGLMNTRCNIRPGTPMSLNHMICVKFYSDFTEKQRKFKKFCRRLKKEESLEKVMARNREIAHWCRLLKESIMFYGDTMGPRDVVWSGLNAPLIFKSLHQRFECPLSTTREQSVAHQFAAHEETGNHGVILKLKRANPKTRYLDVKPFTFHNNEKEWLFMGSTLKIVDIIYEGKPLKNYVSTLQLFEQIVRGQFLTGNKKSQRMLPAVLDWAIAKRKQNETTVDVNDVPPYILALFESFLDEVDLKYSKGTLWLNHSELGKKSYLKIREKLIGDGQLFDSMQFAKIGIGRVQQFTWKIDGDDYEALRALAVSDYKSSEYFEYKLDDGLKVLFHLRCYSKYNEDNDQCAIYLEIDEIPDSVKKLRIEADILCKVQAPEVENLVQKRKVFRHLMKTHTLKRDHRVCGFQLFDHKELEGNVSMEWMVGVKILRAEHFEYDEQEEYLRDMYHKEKTIVYSQ